MTTKTKPTRAKTPRKRAPKRKPIGVIDATKAYNLDQFMKVMGCNWPAVRNMKRRGLKVRKDGGRVMIRGQDYLDYLATLPASGVGGQSENHSDTSVPENQAGSTLAGGDGAA